MGRICFVRPQSAFQTITVADKVAETSTETTVDHVLVLYCEGYW